MASLTNTKIKDTYPGLLKTTDNAALGGTYKLITDGLGNSSGVYLGTGGNVGIGAATPDDGDLQIGDSNTSFNIAFAGPRTKFGYDGTNAVVQGGTSKGIKFCVNNSTFGSGEAMRIKDSNGYVGIGEIDPSKPLTIKKDQSETAILVQSSDTGLSGIYLGGISDSIKGGLILDNSDDSLQLRGYNNANRLHVKSNGNIGIGTTSPDVALEVVGNGIRVSDGTGQGVVYFRSDRNDIYIKENGNFQVETGAPSGIVFECDTNSNGNGIFNVKRQNASRFYITDGGNVGIGTTDAQKKLVISEITNSTIRINSTKSGNWTTGEELGRLEWFGNDISGEGAAVKGFIALKSSDQFGAGFHMTFGTTDGTNGISERMRITRDGKVGINYTNPQQNFEVSGTSRFSRNGAESSQYMEFIPTSTGNTLKAVGQSKSLIFDNTSSTVNEIHFRQGGSNKMIIKSGVILVGKSSSSSSTTGVELNPVGLVQVTRNGNLPLLVNRTGTDGTVISIRNDGSQVGSISVSGSTTSYNTSSDYRLKENVVDMTGALDRVEQLQPKRFNFISDAETTVDGFIAHEVQSVIPEAVFGEKDAIDDEGNAEYQGIDQSKIVPLLVGAIKELKAEIETLKSQIN